MLTCGERYTLCWPSSFRYIVHKMCPNWQHTNNVISGWIKLLECCLNIANILVVGNLICIDEVLISFFILDDVVIKF